MTWGPLPPYKGNAPSRRDRFVDIEILGGVARLETLTGLSWKAWTPTYTNLTLGNGVVTARYVQIGDTVIATYHLDLGTTTTVDGSVTISTPVTAAPEIVASRNVIGQVALMDGATWYPGQARLTSTTVIQIAGFLTSGTYATAAGLSSTVPFTWTTDDRIAFTVVFEAA